MFIRLEGVSRANANGQWAPFSYHVGFDEAFTTLTIPAAIEVAAQGTGPRLSVAIDRLIEPTSAPLPRPTHNGADTSIINNLQTKHPFTLQ